LQNRVFKFDNTIESRKYIVERIKENQHYARETTKKTKKNYYSTKKIVKTTKEIFKDSRKIVKTTKIETRKC